MLSTRVLRHQYHPMIRFIGKRSLPKKLDHKPHPHPASPSHDLPDSFASYRKKAQQHGPLGSQQQASSEVATGSVGQRPGISLGPIEPAKGEYFDRDELPQRFRRTTWTVLEMEAIDSGGATVFG